MNILLKTYENSNSNKSFQKERESFLWGFIGHNRTGKSVTAAQLAKDWKEGHPDGVVMSFDPQRRFADVTDFPIKLSNSNWEDDICDLRNALLILDELRIIHPSAKCSDKFREFLQMRGEHNVDCMYIVHNPALVLNDLTYFTTHYFIYYTQAKLGGFEKKMPNYWLCYGASQFVNKYVKTFGKGEYPNFPYMVVENETEEMYGINMPKASVDEINT